MKNITFLILLNYFLFSQISFSQTLIGASVTQVELSSTTTVVDGDSGSSAEFAASSLRLDVDGNQITIRALGGFNIGVSTLNFNFSGGTFGSITGASVNLGSSTADTSGVGASFTATSVALTGLSGKSLTASTEFIFDITLAAANTVPTVITTSASSIGNTSATLGGNVTEDGGATVTEKGIVY